MAGVGECLNGHAASDGAIANNGDHLAINTLLSGRQCHAHGSGNAGGGVSHAEGVVLTFRTLRKACQPVGLSHAVHLSPAASEDFMGIGLMTYIPDNAIVRCVVDMVQSDSELDHAQACSKMPTRLAYAV